MKKHGVFCEIYGSSIYNRILEYFLENYELDIAASDIVKDLGISKPKVYQIIESFLQKKFIIKSRIIGKTQLYKLDKQNKIVKLFLENFKRCLDIVCEEYSAKKEADSAISSSIAVKC
jgi:sugar-specific transcriptional regulator TrmB